MPSLSHKHYLQTSRKNRKQCKNSTSGDSDNPCKREKILDRIRRQIAVTTSPAAFFISSFGTVPQEVETPRKGHWRLVAYLHRLRYSYLLPSSS